MQWFLFCLRPNVSVKIKGWPIVVGRSPHGKYSATINDPTVSREQFVLESHLGRVQYVNLSRENSGLVDGVEVLDRKCLDKGTHLIEVGSVVIGIGTDYKLLSSAVKDATPSLFMARCGGRDIGPLTADQLIKMCEDGSLGRKSQVWYENDSTTVYNAEDIVEFDEFDQSAAGIDIQSVDQRFVSSDSGVEIVIGENFRCPYCRTVCDIADMLSVSVSPSLLGDSVLGEDDQARFLPTNFTSNGLAIDADGGVCTEIACPRCHMPLPQTLLQSEQIVMSVIGAAGSGKSVFLASSTWQCRQLLGQYFGITFMDLDPVANTWINAYEEKLFFQEDETSLQQIAKTDVSARNVCRSVMIDGGNVLLPLPSFFSVRPRGENTAKSLVVYDSAGAHFRAGADTQSSSVTLNMLSADVLYFLFDPSADPRFRQYIDRGEGTAKNYAQRQDILLSEMSARIKRHLGNLSEGKISRPLIFGVSKADLLYRWLPIDIQVYQMLESGICALDIAALKSLSDRVEGFLSAIAPEITATARDIASNVWFLPMSALGHNPKKEGVRPCDISPVYAELPVVFTLASKGMIQTVNGNI